jgi:hypothetical protein
MIMVMEFRSWTPAAIIRIRKRTAWWWRSRRLHFANCRTDSCPARIRSVSALEAAILSQMTKRDEKSLFESIFAQIFLLLLLRFVQNSHRGPQFLWILFQSVNANAKGDLFNIFLLFSDLNPEFLWGCLSQCVSGLPLQAFLFY